ncbi:hypothetical protein N7452_002135 [Penicillium brevicompactum]|uniref:Uncharacterized protein n=1 Tax=Penicillium brevicompactum TaxID=5074 RepID=A0A9W9R3R3_PENBR|nr:hypothetical protein N7452_002135 [Penicillium brevicompactum]
MNPEQTSSEPPIQALSISGGALDEGSNRSDLTTSGPITPPPPSSAAPSTPVRPAAPINQHRHASGMRYHPVVYNGVPYRWIPRAPLPVKLEARNFNKIMELFQQALRDNGNSAFRIGVTIPTEYLDGADFLESVRRFLGPFMDTWVVNPDLTRDNQVHLLGVVVRPCTTYAVVEINNFNWDFYRAHVQGHLLPVYTLSLEGLSSVPLRQGFWHFERDRKQDRRVLNEVQIYFRRHGYAPTPLLDVNLSKDRPPVYPSPRV